jgi:TatA/E family protein of Tat protein translocase
MPQVGPLEVVVVLMIALFVLGPDRLPDAARKLAEGIRDFRHSLEEHSNQDSQEEHSNQDSLEDESNQDSQDDQ